MRHSDIGVDISGLGPDPKAAIARAATMGFASVQIPVGGGPTSPDELSQSGRRHLARLVTSRGMTIAALGAGDGLTGVIDPADVDRSVDRLAAVVRLAGDVRARLVCVRLGQTRDPHPQEKWAKMIHDLADPCYDCGVTLAVESSGGDSPLVSMWRERGRHPGLRFCVDPGEMTLQRVDPSAAIGQLADGISLVYLRDAVGSPDRVGGVEAVVGQGQVEWAAVLAALESVDFRGRHVIRQMNSRDPIRDIGESLRFVRRMVGQ
jgi:sugar phosphate isomerase/epimerase